MAGNQKIALPTATKLLTSMMPQGGQGLLVRSWHDICLFVPQASCRLRGDIGSVRKKLSQERVKKASLAQKLRQPDEI
jgi:hypothetical protein